MKKIIAISSVIISILLTLVFAGGCLGQRIAEKVTEEAIEKAIEKESGQDVEIDLDEGEITIQGDDGEVNISSDDETVEIQSDEGEATFGTGAELPEDFPAEVPVYGNMEINSSIGSTDGEGKSSFTVIGLSNDAFEDVEAWYEKELDSWDIISQSTMETDDGKFASVIASSNDYDLSVNIAETDEGVTVIIGVSGK